MTTATASSTREAGISRAVVMVGNEVLKGLRHAWSERVQILIELPLFVISVLLFSLLLGRGDQLAATTERLPWQFDPYRTTWMFLGFAVFAFVYLQSVKTFWRLLGEIQTGTLEQTYLPRSRPGSTSPSAASPPPSPKPCSWSARSTWPPASSWTSSSPGTPTSSSR